MAITGIALVLFVIVHMVGNLQFFLGQDALNSYAALLKSNKAVLWGARAGLLAVFLGHLFTAIRLKLRNKAARPNSYQYSATVKASGASRTMIITGLILLAYTIYHISHFTLGLTHPNHFSLTDPEGRHDVYGMVLLGFQSPAVAWGYVAAMLALAYHLSHGIKSVFQTIGFNNENYNCKITATAIGIAVFLFLGFSAIPVSIQLGLVN